MGFLRNTFAVLLGLAVAMFVIAAGLRLNSEWVTYSGISPYENWGRLLEEMYHDKALFVVLLISTGVASIIGGVTTAIVVKQAKVAYAMLIGFILLFMAVLDIIIFPYHPTFYQVGIFLTFFPFSWIGGKIVEIFFSEKKK